MIVGMLVGAAFGVVFGLLSSLVVRFVDGRRSPPGAHAADRRRG